MPKFRKKPVVIDAVRFDPCGAHKNNLPEGVEVLESPGHADNYGYMGFKFGIKTIEGVMEAKPGDWVITGVKGERYPCKHEIFIMTYEPAPSDDAAVHEILKQVIVPRGPDREHELPRGGKP
jgi:hypothetical protein